MKSQIYWTILWIRKLQICLLLCEWLEVVCLYAMIDAIGQCAPTVPISCGYPQSLWHAPASSY